VAGVQFRLDGAPLSAEGTGSPYSISWNTTTASNGSHTLTAVARDAAGNRTTSAAINVTVSNDTTPPVISAVAASSISTSGATISWTTDEASDSQVDYGLTTAYGSTSALNSNLVTAHAATLTGLASATLYHFRVRSRDAAGNLATSADFTLTTLDGTAPSVSITAPAANATVSGSITVNATAADNVGVSGVQFRLDGAPLGAEDVASPYSISWNTSGSADLVFGVTKVIVGPMAMTAGSGFTKRLSVSCPSCTGEDMVTEDMILTSTGQTAATWTFSIPAHYLAQMVAFKAAGTPAYIQGVTATSNSASATIGQTFGANVATGNLLVVAVAWQGTSALGVTDSQGNIYSVATQEYDSINGQSLAILYAPSVNGGATTVTASFSGTTPTVRRLELHEYSGIATTSPLDVTATNSADGTTTVNTITSGSATTTVTAPVPNGSYTLTARARDAAGNTTTSAAVAVTVNNGGDTTPPVISGINVSAITSSAATFTWTTNEASDSEVEYGATTYGGFSTLDVNRVTAHTMGLSGLAPSTVYHYRVRSRDAAGNLGLSSDFTFTTLEGTPPTVAITAPLAGAIVSGTIMVTANANDNVGVAGVQFQVDGAPLGAEDTIAPYGVAWDTTTAAPGLPVLTAVARDAAGNRTTSSPVAVTVASVSAEVELAWDANTEPDIAGYRVYFGTSSGSYSVNLDVGNVTDFVVTGLQTGTLYYFAVTAYNSSGFESGVSNQVSATR
jgi:Bacterial Ig domain/Purple acid Phosphatase, N-terminal domain/Fibronectin type III domain/Bacterial Ig-like domain